MSEKAVELRCEECDWFNEKHQKCFNASSEFFGKRAGYPFMHGCKDFEGDEDAELVSPNLALATMPKTAELMQDSANQMAAYLGQMGRMMIQMQQRLDELEEKQRMVTLSHDEVKAVTVLIKNRAWEYCEKYELLDSRYALGAVARAIKKAVLQRYGVKDLHDVPAIARQAVEAQINRWADIRLVMKCREKLRAEGGS